MLELFNKKYYKVFSPGSYPQGTFDIAFIRKLAANYDKRLHTAPVWEGHPVDLASGQLRGNKEPEALAWVDSLLEYAGDLYASFFDVTEDFIRLVAANKYKYFSIEFGLFDYDGSGQFKEWIHAIGLLNRPGDYNPERISFNFSKDASHTFSPKFKDIKVFNFQNQNQFAMNEFLVSIAKAMGVDSAKFSADDKLAAAITAKFTEFNSTAVALTAKVAELEKKTKESPAPPAPPEQVAEFNQRIQKLEDEKCELLVDSAIQAKKLKPEQRDAMIKFAKSEYDSCKAYLAGLAPDALFSKDSVHKGGLQPDGVNLEDPKFKNEKGEKLTYSDLLKKPASFADKFSAAEIAALKADDPVYGVKK